MSSTPSREQQYRNRLYELLKEDGEFLESYIRENDDAKEWVESLDPDFTPIVKCKNGVYHNQEMEYRELKLVKPMVLDYAKQHHPDMYAALECLFGMENLIAEKAAFTAAIKMVSFSDAPCWPCMAKKIEEDMCAS